MKLAAAVLAAVALAVVAIPHVARAQVAQTIDPGMTREQVVAKLGQPLSARTYESFTYLLYKNGCEKKCGMNDLVVLDSGKVVDAVFRLSSRHYSGTSSSPRMLTSDAAKPAADAQPVAPPAKPPATNVPPKKPAH
jgi:hypothetical protein